MWIPGFGPLMVAGRLASTLLGVLGGIEGVVAGAAWGGVFGTLVGAVSGEHIAQYEEHVKAGRYLVVAHGSNMEVECAHNILQATGAIELEIHTEANL